MDNTLILRLATALALGLIIGMERGWQSRDSPIGSRVAGFRSFGLVGLLGGVVALLSQEFGTGFLAISLLSIASLIGLSYWLTAQQTQDFGITTELALLITFVLGVLAGQGLQLEALAAAVVTTVILGFKQELHTALERLDRKELTATIQLLIIVAVALPLLPNQDLGPWQALNPHAIGWLVLLIAGISYIGYFAIRWLGARVGLLATAIIGALVSSTAVTLSFSRMARQGQASIPLLGAGISLAAGTMALRILSEVTIVNSALLSQLALPIALLALIPLIAAGFIARQQSTPNVTTDVPLRNPIELGAALTYAAIMCALFILIRAMESWFGNAGVYILAAISGITDVDAVSISLAQSTKSSLPLSVGAAGILLAALVNTIVKAGLALVIGGWQLGRWCATILLSSLGASLLAALWTVD